MNESKDAILSTREDQFNDEVSLLDLIRFARRNFYVLLSGALLGAASGLAIALIVPAKWEASALIRVGQLGSSNAGGTKSVIEPSQQIEPSSQVVDRIKNKSFQNDVLNKLGISTDEDDDDAAKDFRESLKVKLEKSDLIGLTIRGNSPEEANKSLSAVIAEVKQTHTNMLTPSIYRLQQELASTEQELKKASAESERLIKSLDGKTDSLNDKSFSQAALLSNILLARESELENVRDRKRELEEMLSPERTFATKEIGRVEVSKKPVFPKKSLFTVIGLFFGLLLGVLVSMLRANAKNN